MGVTLRYDLLANSKNGGGGGGIALNGNGMDPSNGFGVDADCLAQSKAGGGLSFECKGPCARMSRSTCCSIRPSRSP